MKKIAERRSVGNILDFLTAGITIIAIAVVVLASFHSMELLIKKLEVSQIARKYILIMETKGCLEESAKNQMFADLQAIGLHNIDIAGTTQQAIGYGEPIMLCIKGSLSGSAVSNNIWSDGFEVKTYYVEEKRMSTAKN